MAGGVILKSRKMVLAAVCSAALAIESIGEPARPTIVAAEQVGTRIVMLDPDVVAPENARIIWEWKPKNDPNVIAAGLAGRFGNPDECKMSSDRTKILMCSSDNGFAVVDVATTNAVACGYVPFGGKYANLHSISELPDGNVVVAGSEHPGCLVVVDISTPCSATQPQSVLEYPGGHGVIWDWDRNCLWATGTGKLSRFSYDRETKTLTEEKTWAFPKGSESITGHDLVWKDAAHTRIVVTGGIGLMYLDMADADTATALTGCEPQLQVV